MVRLVPMDDMDDRKVSVRQWQYDVCKRVDQTNVRICASWTVQHRKYRQIAGTLGVKHYFGVLQPTLSVCDFSHVRLNKKIRQ